MKKSYIEILPKIGAAIKKRELTNFLEYAEILGYCQENGIALLGFLQKLGGAE